MPVVALLIACDEPGDRLPETAAQSPAFLRAFGNEPFWHVDILEEGGLVYNRLGEDSISFPYVAPVVGEGEEGVRTYGPVNDATGDHRIFVVIVEQPCQDTMADQVHPMSASVTVDGEDLRGCARPMVAPAGEEVPAI